MNCRICGSDAPFFSHATLLGKYKVAYYRCHQCGFIETEEPYWFDEAYSAAIAASDVGMVSRSIGLATVSKAVIGAFLNPEGRFVDYGGGYGPARPDQGEDSVKEAERVSLRALPMRLLMDVDLCPHRAVMWP